MKDFSKGSSEKWTFDHLNHFLAAPKKYIAGTAMGFAGLPKDADRANVILYLHTLADSPAALPDANAPSQ
jgi:cytochrome c